MEGLVKGDIVIIDFPYSDFRNAKRRPVLILKVPKGNDVIVVQITGSSHEKSVEISIKENDFQKGNLKIESFIRIDKVASMEKSLIRYKAGSLKNEKFEEILTKVISFLKD